MLNTLKINRNLIIFGIPFSLFGILIFSMKSSFFTGDIVLNLAVTIDLLIIIPFVYFLLIRKSRIPKTTVIPLMIIGLLIGSYFLPKENQEYLTLFKTWVLPIIELTVLTYIIIKVRSVVKEYKTLSNSRPDFFSAIKSACKDILPEKVVSPFATEVAVFYYGFFDWRKRETSINEFTYHKNSGTLGLMGGILMIISIETVALHFLFSNWNSTIAWVLTILSVYSAIQILGIAKSLTKRPIEVANSGVNLKYGIANEVFLSFDCIESLELSSKEMEKEKLIKRLSILGELEGHNVIIKVNKEKELIGLYGFKKKFNTLLLFVDEPVEFKSRIDSYIVQREIDLSAPIL